MVPTTFTLFMLLPAELRCAIWLEAVPARILRVNIRGYGSPQSEDVWFEFVSEPDFSRYANLIWNLMQVCWEAYIEVRRALPDRALFAVPEPKKFVLSWLPFNRSRDLFCVRNVFTVAKNLFRALGQEDSDIAVAPPLHTIAVEPQLAISGSSTRNILPGDQIMYTAAFLGAERVCLLHWGPEFETLSPESLSSMTKIGNIPNLRDSHLDNTRNAPSLRAYYRHMWKVAESVEEEEGEEVW